MSIFCVLKLQLERSEWGSDLPSVEMHMENHKSVHRAIEEFQMSLKDAKLSEVSLIQIFPPSRKCQQSLRICRLKKPHDTLHSSDSDDDATEAVVLGQTEQTREAV